MTPTRRRTQTFVAVLAAVTALALATPAASAQTYSRAFYRTTGEITLAGSVSCGASGEGTYVVDTEVAVTLVAQGAIEPSGTISVPAGSQVTFAVTGPNTLSLAGDDDQVETLFANTGCSGELTITVADDGASIVRVRNVLRSRFADRAAVLESHRTRGRR